MKQYTNEELIQKIRQNTADAGLAQEELIRRHMNMVRIKARGFYMHGGSSEDIIQEGMLGLFKAIRDYDESCGVQFNTFASLCAQRQIISAIKASRRLKHGPLNFAESLENEKKGISASHPNPETLLIDRESHKRLTEYLATALTKLESSVLELYLEGHSYAQIAETLGKNLKAVENAVQRVRRKVNGYHKPAAE